MTVEALEMPTPPIEISAETDQLVIDYVAANLKKFSHLKLHKMLYFVQGYHLAYFGVPILDQDFQAWVHGPVLPALFRKLVDQIQVTMNDELTVDARAAKTIKLEFAKVFSEDQQALVDRVLDAYKGLSGIALEEITVGQTPWLEARGATALHDKSEVVISKESMERFFKQEQGW